jgi:YggT family protein
MTGNFFGALAQIIHFAIQVYIFIIIIRSVASWMGNVPPNPFFNLLKRLTDPVFRFVHRVLPYNVTIIGNIDISPIIIILALYLVDRLVTGLLTDYAIQFRGG